MQLPPCPFCDVGPERIVLSDPLGVVIRDAFPIAPGHTLIVPRRHIGSFFLATEQEQQSLLALLREAKVGLESEFAPDAWNIGINDGPAAGQTVPHLHIHLIPRYTNDVPDPRGGVRWVIPSKANYWGGNGA